jgi:hypothetical protein
VTSPGRQDGERTIKESGDEMTKGFIFWLLMVIWLVLGTVTYWPYLGEHRYGLFGGNLMLFVLLALLGWKVFGPVVKSDS